MRPASDAKPWLAEDSRSSGSVASEGHKQLFAHWFGALVWNAMAVPIAFVLLGEGGADLLPFLRWVLAGFVALGGLILFNAIVYSARIAGIKANDESLVVKGSVLASDAFFPFRDGIDAAAKAGISAVIEPGGSMRDDEVIAAADEHGMAMVFTGMRHFKH